MKYGLDIKSDFLREKIGKALSEEGHTIISMDKLEYYNKGDLLVKKVLLANQTRVDFYIKLDISEDVENRLIFYGDRSVKSLELYESLHEEKELFNSENIKYIEGLNYYLIKNIKGSVVFLDIHLKEVEPQKIADYVIKGLLSLKDNWYIKVRSEPTDLG